MMTSGRIFLSDASKYIGLPRAPARIVDRDERPRQLPHENDRVKPEAADAEEPRARPDVQPVIQPVQKEHEEEAEEVHEGEFMRRNGMPNERADKDDGRDECE